MTEPLSSETLELALQTLEAEAVTTESIAAFRSTLRVTDPVSESDRSTWYVNEQVRIEHTVHGTLTFFLAPSVSVPRPCRLATFDRHGRLLLLLSYAADGRLQKFKVRNLDGRFLGIVPGAASHLGWGASDVIWALEGEGGFEPARSLTLFRSVAYESIDALPPLDDPVRLPAWRRFDRAQCDCVAGARPEERNASLSWSVSQRPALFHIARVVSMWGRRWCKS